MQNILLYLLCLFLGLTVLKSNAQLQQKEYTAVDSIARTKKYNGDLRLLVSQLTNGYTDQELKARAIFVWITDNIAYDYKAYNKRKHYPAPDCGKGDDCLKIIAEWKEDYTDKVLRQGKSVCDGYSWLFKRMCDYAGLQTDFVPGYTKKSPGEIGRLGSLDHAWNGIILNGKYYYLDATWAAGHGIRDDKGKLIGFRKKFNDFYWLTPLEKFCMEHYPKDEKSPGVVNYSKQRYKNNPYAFGSYFYETEIIAPQSGVIEAHVGDTIHFEIKNSTFIIDIEYSTNTELHPYIDKETQDEYFKSIKESDEKHRLNVTKNQDIYSFDYVVTNPKLRYIEIYNFYMRAYLFKFKILPNDNKKTWSMAKP